MNLTENNIGKTGEKNTMENDFGTQDILTGRGLGIGGFGYGNYGYGQFANPSANAVRINRNSEIAKLGIDRISDQNEENRRNSSTQNLTNTIMDGFNRICDRLNSDAVANRDAIFAQELRNGDRLSDIEREMNANARKADECCCTLQRQACEDKSEILAAIAASESRGIERQLNAAQAELVALKTQVACGCTTGCSTPCHGHGH